METVKTAHPAPGAPPKQRAVRNAIVAFVFMMITLTLFSNTVLNYSLPQVSVEKPEPGALSHDISGTGFVEPAEIVDVNIDTRWTVDQVLVKTGDKVAQGQTLATFKTDEARNGLLDEEARYEQKRIALEKLQESYIEAQQSGSEAESRKIKRDIDSAVLDLQIQQRQIDRLRKQLETDAALEATVSGTIVEVNAVAGLAVPSGRSIVRIANEAKGHHFKTTVDADKAKYVAVGDEVEIIVAALDNARLKGKLAEVNDPAADEGSSANGSPASWDVRKKLVVALQDDRLKGGEAGELLVTKTMPPSRLLISNAAVREDDTGKYVLVLKEKKGPLGNEFYAQRAAVTVGDADDEKTSIESGITLIDQVIVSGSKAIEDGDRVMMSP